MTRTARTDQMLSIRREQMHALRASRVRAFRDRLIRLARTEPALAVGLDRRDAASTFDRVLAAAASRGFASERSVALFFLLSLKFGDGVFRDDLFRDCAPDQAEPARLAVYLENLRDVLTLHGHSR